MGLCRTEALSGIKILRCVAWRIWRDLAVMLTQAWFRRRCPSCHSCRTFFSMRTNWQASVGAGVGRMSLTTRGKESTLVLYLSARLMLEEGHCWDQGAVSYGSAFRDQGVSMRLLIRLARTVLSCWHRLDTGGESLCRKRDIRPLLTYYNLLQSLLAKDSSCTYRSTGLWDNLKVAGAKDFVNTGEGQEQYWEVFPSE